MTLLLSYQEGTMEKALVPTTQTAVVVSVSFDASILTGQLAQSSINMYRRDFEAYATFAGADLLDASMFARWRVSLASDTNMSPNTINRMLSAVKRIMREAANQGHSTQELADTFEQVRGVKVGALKDRLKQTARTL